MFQKIFDEAGAPCLGGLTLTSNMDKSGLEPSFDRMRRAATRKNRSTAGDGMFCRSSRVYRRG